MSYRTGTDLILGLTINGKFCPLGHSTTCKISDSTETGERVTKEKALGKFKEKYVKSLSEQITAEGFVYAGDEEANKVGMPTLKKLWMDAQPVEARYTHRNLNLLSPDGAMYYYGQYIITSLEHDGSAGDDEKYSLTLENAGPVQGFALTKKAGATADEQIISNTGNDAPPTEAASEIVNSVEYQEEMQIQPATSNGYGTIGTMDATTPSGDDSGDPTDTPDTPEG